VIIELTQFIGRYPKFLMRMIANDMNLKFLYVRLFYLKARNETGKRMAFCIPITSNLFGVFKIQHRIEDRLIGEPGWKSRETRLSNEFKLFQTDGAIHDHTKSQTV